MKVKPPILCGFCRWRNQKREVAKRGAVNHPEDTVFAFKRLVGHKNSDEVVQNLNVPYQLKPAKNGDARVAVTVDGKEELWSPEQLSARY